MLLAAICFAVLGLAGVAPVPCVILSLVCFCCSGDN